MATRRLGPKTELKKGAWTASEDRILANCVETHGETAWGSVPFKAGLNRCGKSCRLRWLNYLSPNIKRDNISPDEEELIIRMHRLLGNRWSLIAGRLPGRTDNQIKNYWHTHIRKKLGIPNTISKRSTSKGSSSQLKDYAPHSIIRPVPYKHVSSSSPVNVRGSTQVLTGFDPCRLFFGDSQMTDLAENPVSSLTNDCLLFESTSFGMESFLASFPELDDASLDLSFMSSPFVDLGVEDIC